MIQTEVGAVFQSLHAEIRPCLSQILGSLQLIERDLKALKLSSVKNDLAKIRTAADSFSELLKRFVSPSGAPREGYDLRTVRHELRTPIGHIIGYGEMLLEELEEDGVSDFSVDLKRMIRSAQQMLGLLNENFHQKAAEELVSEFGVEPGRTVRISDGSVPPARILVVDDNERNRELLTRHLERHAHQVETAENGRAGLRLLEAQDFDLLLLDVMMPELDGFGVLEYLKEHPTLCRLPVIMVSANDELESVVRCIEMGAEDYITKPISPVLLFARVEASLEKKRLRDHEQQHLRRIELEQARSEMLLLNILPPSIAQRLKQSQATIADSFAQASVLFADVIGFTGISARMRPEALVNSLNTVFKAYDGLTERYGLEKIKTIGDAYMVAAGLPVPREDHAQVMVDFALEIVEETRRLSPKLIEPFEVRVGVSSGPVVAGVIGRKKFCYDLWGDTVNTASRMSSIGKEPGIRVTAATFELLNGTFQHAEPETVEVKGKGSMLTYAITGRKG